MSYHDVTIEDLIARYSIGLDQPLRSQRARRNGTSTNQCVVLLTGTTGSLGSEVLRKLISEPSVAKVYAYNRPCQPGTEPLSITERHRRRFEDHGFDLNILKDPRIVFLEGQAYQSKLGLESRVYEELLRSVTHIIHCAWSIDVYPLLFEFEDQIAGMRNLIQSWDPSLRAFPENEIVDPRTAEGSGYGESKYVAETLLAKSGLRGISLRVDQICGSMPSGAWDTTNWIPILVKTSITMDMIYVRQGISLCWVPSDTVADAIWDIACFKGDLPLSVNVAHPQPIPWEEMINYAVQAVEEQGKGELPIVPWSEWMEELVLHQRLGITKDLPATEITEFLIAYSTLLARRTHSTWCDTDLALKLSPSLKNAAPIGLSHVRLWIKYWIRHGF